MERMLRKRKNNSEYEIDRELTGKFAIEKNVEYQEKIEQLEEENKKLKVDLMEDMKEITKLEKENIKLKAELSKYKKQYQHSMGFMEEDTLQELRDLGEI